MSDISDIQLPLIIKIQFRARLGGGRKDTKASKK